MADADPVGPVYRGIGLLERVLLRRLFRRDWSGQERLPARGLNAGERLLVVDAPPALREDGDVLIVPVVDCMSNSRSRGIPSQDC